MRQRSVNLIYLLFFILLLTLPAIARRLQFYGLGDGDRAALPTYDVSDVSARVPTPAAGEFVDEPAAGDGLVLLDVAHNNAFELDEIGYLDSRLAARGFELSPFEGGDLADALRPVNALIVVAPLQTFTPQEVQDVSAFVGRGGLLLMVGDPTRFQFDFGEEDELFTSVSLDTDEIPLNSLANAFDLTFNGDYLYNTFENEGNFRNIILGEESLAGNELTEDLSQLVFYGSHSLQLGRDGRALLTGDDNTWSSATDRPGGLVLAGLGGDGRVLAVGDLDFLAEPYYTVHDNSRFIARIADFLTATRRDFTLADFPYFFDQSLDLVYAGDPELGPDAFDEIIALQDAFRDAGWDLALSDEPGSSRDVLYLGLYNQAAELADLLDEAGITLIIDPPIEEEEPEEDLEAVDEQTTDETASDQEVEEETEEKDPVRLVESTLGKIQMSGTALLLLDESGDRRQLVVLSASGEGLESVVDRLVSLVPIGAEDVLADCLLQARLALCPTGVANEEIEAKLESGGAPEAEEPPAEESDETQPEEMEEPDEESPTEFDAEAFLEEIDAEFQGVLFVGDSIDAVLEAEQAHAWAIISDPILVDFILQVSEEMDGILELYDSAGELVNLADSTFSGEEERMEFVELTEPGAYTVVVRDFFDAGGEYTLSIEPVTLESLDAQVQGELLFGETATAFMGEGEIHAWTFTVDGPTDIDVTLSSGDEMDGVLVLMSPDFLLVDRADSTLEGEEESLLGISLEAAGEYTVLVGDFNEVGGDYTLLLEES